MLTRLQRMLLVDLGLRMRNAVYRLDYLYNLLRKQPARPGFSNFAP